MARVVAIDNGHDGRVYRRAGEQWDYGGELDKEGKPTDGRTWFVAVEKAPPPRAPAKDKRPPGAGPAKGSAVKSDGTGPADDAGKF